MVKKLLFFILPFVLLTGSIQAQTIINSLAELKSHLGTDDGNFKMTPGTYYFNSDNCGEGKLFSDERLLLFTGNDSEFDFTGVKFEIDTEIFTLYGNNDIIEFWPVGSRNIYKNLTLEDIGMTVPSSGAGSVYVDGADNLIEGFKTTTRGSFPYGYGDTFGKGGGSVISHQKHAGMLVRGDRNHLLNCTVIMRAYGHGIFVQGSHDAIIEGCYIEGETRTVGEMLQEEGTGSPADNVDFLTVWGYDLRDHTSDYTFSLQEAGIRAYSTGGIFDAEGNHTGESRGTLSTTVIDCTIVKMRVGVNTGAEGGTKRIENCTALACEGGFWLGNDGDVINCRADASVGPILSEDISRSNATYEVTILDNYIPKIGNTPYFFMGGSNHNITIHDGTTYYNPDIKIVLGGTRPANRFLDPNDYTGDPTVDIAEIPTRNASGITLTNNTKYPLFLESASNCNITSCGPVTNNGSGNSITQSTDCDYTRPCDNRADNLQAECYDDMSGVEKIAIGNNNEQVISSVQNNDWIRFNNIDLTNNTSVKVIASTNVDGVTIEVRQGSESGTLLATIPVSNTTSFDTYQESMVDLSQTVTGETTICFVFKGDSGTLLNVDKISFVENSCDVVVYYPYLPIGAETFCAASGIDLENRSDFNKVVTNIENGDYIKFSNVDFGYDDVYNTISVLASSGTSGGNIEVRSNAVDAELLATVQVNTTGDDATYEHFKSYTSGEITGKHDIYLVFTGVSGSLFKLDNFQFYEDRCFGVTYEAYSKIEAKDYCGMFGVVPINNVQLGGINDGDWIRFGSVDFTSVSPTQVTLKLGGNAAGGVVNVMLNDPKEGTLIATTTVPDTGGYSSFQSFTVALNQEVTGVQELYFYFENGGFDMDTFEFHQEKVVLPNLALATTGAIASQSTTAYDGDASRANDGDTNGNFGGGSVSHTEHAADGVLKWWQVDLGADKMINEVVIHNRTGSNGKALNNYTVEITNNNGEITYSQLFVDYPNPSTSIDVGSVTGKIIKISKTSDRGVQLAEVEVFGTSSLSTDDLLLGQIEVFPNPTINQVSIRNAANTVLEVFNVNGALELTTEISEDHKTISLQKLSFGIYFLKFRNNQGMVVKKLIKN